MQMEMVKFLEDEFEIGKYLVTQKQWKEVMEDYNPSHFKGDDLPVESISFGEIKVFVSKLNDMEGKQYRLPNALEWDKAAKLEEKESLIDYGWFNCGKTQPVGTKKMFPSGCYDVYGNVWEFLEDGRALRGGSWLDNTQCERTAYRNYSGPGTRYNYLGFRLARTLLPTPDSIDNPTEITAILQQRGNRYGEFSEHARLTQRIKSVMQTSKNWNTLPNSMKESLDMIAHKMGRILNGDMTYKDSWVDIIGYAELINKEFKDE